MKKRIGTAAVCLLLFLTGFSFFTRGEAGNKPGLAPMNPEFLRYQARAGSVERFSDDGYPLGRIPAPVKFFVSKAIANREAAVSYPAYYDLRNYGKVTDVRDQGSCGACWTFAALASMESALKPDETWNFSEQHLNSKHGFDYPECEGGNAWMSTAYAARWDGPINESDMVYPYSAGAAAASAATTQKHVQQVIFFPERQNALDNNAIKHYLTQVGAVSVSFAYMNGYFNSATNGYYCHNRDSEVNHIVAIVGWDDAFAASNFTTPPPGNGAFIVKNSWGSNWGKNGYFYISYYDVSLCEFVGFSGMEDRTNYPSIYQYDPLGWVGSWGLPGLTCWGANIFTAGNNRPLRAVGFYTTDIDAKYKIYVYTGVAAGKPRSGTLAAVLSGVEASPGFHTEVLGEAVPLSGGERFSVVIQFTNRSDPYPLAVEFFYEGYSSAATAHPGESFISYDGNGWSDASNLPDLPKGSVCIKAYAASDKLKLTLKATASGSTNPAPGAHWISRGSEKAIRAVPEIGCAFTGWSGDGAGTENPLTVVMDKDKTIIAAFRPILAPLNATGRKVLNRSFSQAEYIDTLTWSPNPGNSGLEISGYRIYEKSSDSRTLLEEVAADKREYCRRLAGASARTYEIVALAAGDWEGPSATVTAE
jgi:C1A family cysteine protease